MESSSNSCKKSCLPIVIVGLFLAFGIALSGFFISKTIYNAKVALNTAEVKGLAVRRVKSDRANWVIVFKNTANSRQDIPELYKKSEKDQRTIIKLLEKNGFQEQEIELGVLDYFYQEFRDENQKLVDEKHQLIGSISIETNKVELVSKVRTKINKLIAEGIDVENRAPAYRFTKLNEIKPEMLRESLARCHLVDLYTMDDDDILKSKAKWIMEFCLKHARDRDMAKVIEEVFKKLETLSKSDREKMLIYLTPTFCYIMSITPEKKQNELNEVLIENLSKLEKENIMRTVEDAYVEKLKHTTKYTQGG